MDRLLLLNNNLLQITVNRLCHQLLENHAQFEDTVLIGLQPRGIFLANRIQHNLEKILNKPVSLGYLDTTFHRDDFRRREQPIKANETRIPFIIEDKNVVVIDDVLFTGRTVRAALDAMISFGRPRKVELLVLVNRKYSRDLPIEPNYTGKNVNTIQSQRVLVDWKEQDKAEDNIWLVNKED